MADTSKLVAIRAKLNTDIDALIAAGNPDQATIDNLTSEATVLDNDVVTATAPPPAKLDFTVFDANVAAFKADSNLSQQDVDNVAQIIKVNTPA